MIDLQGKRPGVWVIDDDQSIRWILDRALSNVGFEVTAFETASKALTSFKRAEKHQRPTLILSDFRMPGINGFELLKQIHNLDTQIPVIIMTAYSDLDTTIQAHREGAYEYLNKPFDIDDAIDLVRRAYRQTQNTGTDITDGEGTATVDDWKQALKIWAEKSLARGDSEILTTAIKDFEKTLIDCALAETRGRKQEAAKKLGWGRNTLTRKLKEYH